MSVVEPASTPAATTPEPQGLTNRLGAIIDDFTTSEAGAADPATETPTPADGTPPASQDGAEAKPVETPTPEPEKLEVTPERLADSKFWGSLTKEQWALMERDHPVETKLIKSAQAAATRIVNAARTQPSPETPTPTRIDASPDDEPSPEFLAAYEMSQSFDPKEAAKGQLRMMQLAAPTVLKENGFDPNRAKSDAVIASAYQQATEAFPELATFEPKELEAVIDGSRALLALVNTGTAENIALAMEESGRILSERKKTAAAQTTAAQQQAAIQAKKDATRQVVQSNARPASAAVVTSQSGAPVNGKVALRDKLSERYDQLAPTLQN